MHCYLLMKHSLLKNIVWKIKTKLVSKGALVAYDGKAGSVVHEV